MSNIPEAILFFNTFGSYFIGVYTIIEMKQTGRAGTYPVYCEPCSNIGNAAEHTALTIIPTTHVSVADPRGWNVYL
jgi:hypothetical protein